MARAYQKMNQLDDMKKSIKMASQLNPSLTENLASINALNL